MEWTDSRRETVVAAMASVLLHLVLILCVALALAVPAWQFPVSPPENEAPIEVTILPVEAPKPQAPSYISTSEQNTPEAPREAPFESGKNTRAASETAPAGTAPLPSLDGRDAPSLELETKDYTDGRQSRASAPPEQAAAEQSAPPEPQSTPLPEKPAPSQLALREAPPRPQTEERKPAAPGYQPETRITRIRGNISNRGKASVDAAATPLGRYKKMVSDAIGSRWYYYVNDQIGLLNIGTVEIRFTVSSDGKAGGIKVLGNTSNESFASVSVNSIIEAEIPPIPDEVAKLLDNGRLEIDYTFTILSN
ncbi:MAG: hypothetical protein M0Q93_03590 [Terrimicrobiaceae bacterium]|nr:hypothetical protein [Terrimicrobiaceae bacterium]